MSLPNCVFQRSLAALMECDPAQKVAATHALFADWREGNLTSEQRVYDVESIPRPGLPARLTMVEPKNLLRRKISTPEGFAIHMHAIAHIEFNAINLALDAVYRFPHMPDDYIDDWLKVAAEEATHFSLIQERIAKVNFRYGDFPVHNGLWQMAVDTEADCLARMALVPRVLEARGLDVTPGMIAKFERAGDDETVNILKIIWRDEVGHVRTGSRWFYTLCEQRNLPPISTFIELVSRYSKGVIKSPFNEFSRLEAGFSRSELNHLKALGATHENR